MQIIKASLFCLALLGCSLSKLAGQQSRSSTPPPGPDQSIEGPIIFSEGVISTGLDEKSIAFAPDGKSLYLTKGVKYSTISVILVSRSKNGSWVTPQVAEFSGRYRDKDPCFSPDGKKLYFSSDRPVSGRQPKGFDIWMVQKTGQRWSQPKNLGPPVNTGADEESPSVTSDGTLYFTSDREGGRGDLDIYRARPSPNGFLPPENLAEAINSALGETEVCVDPQERFLLFSSQRPGFGNSDLFISYLENGQWSPARNLGPWINTAAEEHSPSLSPDGRSFFFSSSRGMGQRGSQEQRLNYKELIGKLRSAGNDSLDIYQVSITRVPAVR
jgi:Tol biopolymer transport system component